MTKYLSSSFWSFVYNVGLVGEHNTPIHRQKRIKKIQEIIKGLGNLPD